MSVQLESQQMTDDGDAADTTTSSVSSRGDDSAAAAVPFPSASPHVPSAAAAVASAVAVPTASTSTDRAAQLCHPQALSCLDPLSLLRCSSACRRLHRATSKSAALQRVAVQMPVAVITAGCERAFFRSPLSTRRGQLRVVRRVLAAAATGSRWPFICR